MRPPVDSILTLVNGSSGADPLPTPKKKILRIVFHGMVSAIGGLFIGFVGLGVVSLHPTGPHEHLVMLLTDAPYSPAFWLPAVAVGFGLNRHLGHRSACWVGVVALALLGFLILASIPGYESSKYEQSISNHSFLTYIWGELFSLDSNVCGGDECLGKLLFTAPVLSSVAYSIGAYLGLRSRRVTAS